MSLPAAGYFATSPATGSLKTSLDDITAHIRQMLGGEDESELTISSGSVTATRAMHTIDTEGDAAADDLTNVDISGVSAFVIMLRQEASARVVTLKHEAGSAGQLSLLGGQDLVLDATSKRVLFWIDTGASPTTLREIGRFGFDAPGQLEANTAGSGSPNIITEDEVGKTYTNEGATALNYHTLPAARAGLGPFTFVVQDADGIRVVAASGDTIRIAAGETPAAGYVEATTIGNVVTLMAINDTEWIAVASVGTWTVST